MDATRGTRRSGASPAVYERPRPDARQPRDADPCAAACRPRSRRPAMPALRLADSRPSTGGAGTTDLLLPRMPGGKRSCRPAPSASAKKRTARPNEITSVVLWRNADPIYGGGPPLHYAAAEAAAIGEYN